MKYQQGRNFGITPGVGLVDPSKNVASPDDLNTDVWENVGSPNQLSPTSEVQQNATGVLGPEDVTPLKTPETQSTALNPEILTQKASTSSQNPTERAVLPINLGGDRISPNAVAKMKREIAEFENGSESPHDWYSGVRRQAKASLGGTHGEGSAWKEAAWVPASVLVFFTTLIH